MGFMSPDSAFMRGLSNTVDAIWINLLMIITSIPLITIGAALTAGHDAARRVAIAEGHVTANYFKAFRANFLKATGLWIIFGATGTGLVYSWVVLQITPLLIPKIGLTLVWIIGFEWVWALQARFENSFGGVLANAFIFGVSRIGATLVLVTIDAIFLGLLVASWVYMPQGLFLLILSRLTKRLYVILRLVNLIKLLFVLLLKFATMLILRYCWKELKQKRNLMLY